MSGDEAVLQIKIALEGITPKIWRRFRVKSNITLHQLHGIIQVVIGWSDSHLYSFTINGQEYQDDKNNDMLDFGDGRRLLSSRKLKIDLLRLKQKFYYTYDFGDCWEHLLVVEKILPKEDALTARPFCLEGERNAPPEDCGSVPGYYNLMAVQKNKKHPEYKRLVKDWLGEGWDFEYFNVDEVNRELAKMWGPGKGVRKGRRAN